MHALSPMLKKILEAAEREFGDKGLDGTKIMAIAKAAGTSKQLVYHYFESKERLYEIILRDLTINSFNSVLQSDIHDADPVESIRKFFLVYLDHLEQSPETMVISIDQGLHSGAQLKIDRELVDAREQVLARIAAPLATGQAAGLFKPALDAHMLFFLANAFIVGALSLRKMFAMLDESLAEMSQEHWRELMSGFFLDAIRA